MCLWFQDTFSGFHIISDCTSTSDFRSREYVLCVSDTGSALMLSQASGEPVKPSHTTIKVSWLEGLYLSDSFVFHPVCKFPSPVLSLLPSALMSQKKRADKVNQSRTFRPTLVRASLFTDARVSPLFLLIHYS